jgi:hypothetical protein
VTARLELRYKDDLAWRRYKDSLDIDSIASTVGRYIADLDQLDLWHRTGPTI